MLVGGLHRGGAVHPLGVHEVAGSAFEHGLERLELAGFVEAVLTVPPASLARGGNLYSLCTAQETTMTQLNINLNREFESDLKRYMRLRGIKTKSDAVRCAVREAVEIN